LEWESRSQRRQHATQRGKVHVTTNTHLSSIAQLDFDQI
jgi:hypothetical protein